MRMDETTTSKFTEHNFEQKCMFNKKKAGIDIDISFETKLKVLLDKELLSPRQQIVDEILSLSKAIF